MKACTSCTLTFLRINTMKGKGLNPKKGQGTGPEGRAPTQGPSKEKRAVERGGVSSWRVCPCVGVCVCLLLLLSRSRVVWAVLVWCLLAFVLLVGCVWLVPVCLWFCGFSLPFFRQVPIAGSCPDAGANLRTGRVLAGIHWQLREGIPAR